MRWAWAVTLGSIGCAVEVPLLPEPEGDGLVLLVHGGGDDPRVWAEEMADSIEEIQALQGTDDAWDVEALDWSDDADNLLTAAARGRRVGEALVPAISEWRDVHVIAHSVGAHVAHGIADTELVRSLHLTLLDPFVGSGLVRWGFGRTRFGTGSAFAEAYVNRDDGVPSTDGLLEQAHVFDVTTTRPSSLDGAQDAHRWPVEFYRTSVERDVGIPLARWVTSEPDWDRFPPGEVTAVDGS